MRFVGAFIFGFGCLTTVGLPAFAHEPSTSYLSFDLSSGEARWRIPPQNLLRLFRLDTDQNGRISAAEATAQRHDIQSYALRRIELRSSGGLCHPQNPQFSIDKNEALLRFSLGCAPNPEWLRVRYDAMFEVDENHRAFLNLDTGKTRHTDVFSSRHRQAQYPLEAAPWWTPLRHFIVEGMWHIFIGYDHILFLLTLLLSAVMTRHKAQTLWTFGLGLRRVLRIVTAFTLAHSLTLCIAVLGWVKLPSTLVESVIAASIVFAAVENIRPMVQEKTWVMTFVFGLVHGFGFASVLQDVGLPAGRLAVALLGFNLGVEIGQMILVGLSLPVLWILSRSPLYSLYLVPLGSLSIASLGLYWFVERAFGVSLYEIAQTYPFVLGASLLLGGIILATLRPSKSHRWALFAYISLSLVGLSLLTHFMLKRPALSPQHTWLKPSLGYFGGPLAAQRISELTPLVAPFRREKELLPQVLTTLEAQPQDLRLSELSLLLLARSGEKETALHRLEPVYSSLRTSPLPKALALTWIMLHTAELYRSLDRESDFEAAVGQLKRLIHLEDQTLQRAEIATLASEYWALAGAHKASLRLRDSARQIHAATEEFAAEQEDLEAIAEISLSMAQPAAAIIALRQALVHSEALKDPQTEARLHLRLAQLAELVGSTEEARFHHRRALSLHEELKDLAKAQVGYAALGRIYRDNSELNLAKEMFEQAIKTSEILADRDSLGHHLIEYANLHVMMHEPKNAEPIYRKAIEHAAFIHDREKVGDLWANLARTSKECRSHPGGQRTSRAQSKYFPKPRTNTENPTC